MMTPIVVLESEAVIEKLGRARRLVNQVLYRDPVKAPALLESSQMLREIIEMLTKQHDRARANP